MEAQTPSGNVAFAIERATTAIGPALRVKITIDGGVTTPAEYARAVAALELPQDVAGLGVVFDGPSPVWGYSMLTHRAHHFAWVATWDPRLAAAVVVHAHWPGVGAGLTVRLDP